MGTVLLLVVTIAFLTAILTAGREGDYSQED